MANRTKDDLTGQRFGKWLVEARDPCPDGASRAVFWLVLCDCGYEGSLRTSDLVSGHSTRCRNCYFAEKGATK